jgi:hypothetical protein
VYLYLFSFLVSLSALSHRAFLRCLSIYLDSARSRPLLIVMAEVEDVPADDLSGMRNPAQEGGEDHTDGEKTTHRETYEELIQRTTILPVVPSGTPLPPLSLSLSPRLSRLVQVFSVAILHIRLRCIS